MLGKKEKALDPAVVGRNIRRARMDSKMTHERLASDVGVDERTLYYYETGRRLPSLHVICAIAIALGTRVSDLLS